MCACVRACVRARVRVYLLQDFLSSGSFSPPAVAIERCRVCLGELRQRISCTELENTVVAHEVTVKGTKLRKNMVIVIDDVEEGSSGEESK